jgi:methylenetetrahydrofolate dehydrogenase (NADP+)/methenyltetrahydrofolate cyclohydrolase
VATGTGAPRVLDGTAVARAIRAEVAESTAALAAETGIVPGLSVVLVGDDPASSIYVRNKRRAAEEAGMRSTIERLPADASEARVLDVVSRLNADPEVHGILVQLPLPRAVSTARVIETLDPRKDVDGFHPVNFGKLAAGLPGFVPCTPAGIVALLERNEIPLAGRRAVVVGRSNIVGKPMALLLLARDCTVTVCHSRTPDAAAIAAEADILVAAAGKPGLVTATWIKPGAVVVDVGIHRVESEADCRRFFGDDEARLHQVRERGSTLVGDVHPADARGRAGWLTPVPGGVGPLTIAQLLANTLAAAEAFARERS